MFTKELSKKLTSDVNFVREGERKSGSYLKTTVVLALFGGMAAVFCNMSNSNATKLQN